MSLTVFEYLKIQETTLLLFYITLYYMMWIDAQITSCFMIVLYRATPVFIDSMTCVKLSIRRIQEVSTHASYRQIEKQVHSWEH